MFLSAATNVLAEDIKQSDVYQRLYAALSKVPAIDTHDHLRPFDQLPNLDVTDRGTGMTLHSIWSGSYYTWTNPLSPWPEKASFDTWWAMAKNDFDDARATSFYRYVLPAFRDLYGIDFETMSDDEARQLNDRIFKNYQDDKWLNYVMTERANIELMFIDPYWARFQFDRAYQFSVPLLNVTSMVSGFHASEFKSELDSPYAFARAAGREIKTLDDYLREIAFIFEKAVASDAMCLKSTLAYQRTLDFKNVPRERAERAFGRRRDELTAADIMRRPLICARPMQALADAERTLVHARVGGLPVVENGRLVGVLSRSDIARVRVLTGALDGQVSDEMRWDTQADGFVHAAHTDFEGFKRRSDSLSVRDAMRAQPITCQLTTPVRELAATMIKNHVHRVIVVEGDRPVGIISSLDVVELVSTGS
jgi:CBS domain-containing protein